METPRRPRLVQTRVATFPAYVWESGSGKGVSWESPTTRYHQPVSKSCDPRGGLPTPVSAAVGVASKWSGEMTRVAGGSLIVPCACAAVAVLRRRDRLDAVVRVELPGGVLAIEWQGPGHPVWMSGPATFVFEGEFGENGGQR